jgi:DNA polymerase-3 subunit alpha
LSEAGSGLSASGDSFVHLHTHSEYSILDGAARVDAMVQAAAKDGQPALAITDHGNLYGLLDFAKSCEKAGIVPILGMEAYQAKESRFDRPQRSGQLDDTGGEVAGGEKLYYHLTLLARDNTGYKNLMKLSSASFLDGYYYKPRVDWELLETYHHGLIATTGCLGGLVLQHLVKGDEKGARQAAGRLAEIFGRDSLFVEVQDHGIAEQRRTNPMLVDLARRLGLGLVATNDSHYVAKSDAMAHDVLLCVQTQSEFNDPKRLRFEGEEHYLKTAEEMRRMFAEIPEACDNTLAIAEQIQTRIDYGMDALPEFPVPERITGKSYAERAAKYLRELTLEGAKARYGDEISEQVRNRIDYELSVIEQMGFPAYFLVVWDLICFAKRSGIRVGPGRGSAAGSCVAYCLGIVDLDPIRYDLIFERFLNPGRKQMPDIDMDFDERYRGEMIRYAAERYGSDHVAQIVTFSTIKARAAVRDAARVLGHPYALGDKIAKAMPPLVMGRDTPLWACFEKSEGYEDGWNAAADLREMYEADPQVRQVVDAAKGLEGMRRQVGIHAAAVVITKDPLTEYLPIQRTPEPGKDPSEAPIVTQYEMHGVEELGLLKMDFLGLRNLSVIERTLDLIRSTTGQDVDIDHVDLEDDSVFAMLRKGDSIGVFQLEGGPMRALMRSLAPTRFDDVAALVALYRPGPMAANMHKDYADRKNGRKPVSYLHPDLEPILADTYGLMIYQESVMRVAQKFAGYSLEEADNLRKACGKKIRALIQAEREKFVAGCEAQGYGKELGTQLFDIIEPFADYAFNKSHSYGYGLIAYQTAWLKAHYPVEYMAALLTSVKDDKDKVAVYLAECRRLGIAVLVPDVNASQADFTPIRGGDPGSIRFGLAAVRNVGQGIVEKIVQEREANGSFQSFVDFCERVDPSVLNKRALESLVKAGAFDSLGHTRAGLAQVFEEVTEKVLARRKEREAGVMTLFDTAEVSQAGQETPLSLVIPEIEDTRASLLRNEREMLGLYVSSHPLEGFERSISDQVDRSIADLHELFASSHQDTEGNESNLGQPGLDGEVMNLGGLVTNLSMRRTKRGEQMATFLLEDMTASVEVVVFPRTLETYGPFLSEDAVVLVKARVIAREEGLRLALMEARHLQLTDGGPRYSELVLRLPDGFMTDSRMAELANVIEEHPGQLPVVLHLEGYRKKVRLPNQRRVDIRNGLLGELKVLLGEERVQLVS